MQLPVSSQEYRAQCEIAANESRLPPDQLDDRERQLLNGRLSEKQIRQYLFVRNGILRLWSRNPLVYVTTQEVIETCVLKKSQLGLALVAYEWLVRQGLINFGCLELSPSSSSPISPALRRKTIVVIGAGVAGLACARQLQGLFKQFPSRVNAPEVILLEGRQRIGGRVYSYPLLTQHRGTLPHNLATTAEAGAQIILGFDGNPLNFILRGQLALEYHSLEADDTSSFLLFDADGSRIRDRRRAAEMVKLYNSILDTTSQYSWDTTVKTPTNGFHKMKLGPDQPSESMNGDTGGINGHTKRSTGLGLVLDDLVNASRDKLSLTPLDFRLINWEMANFEYANGACVNQISLGGWAQAEGYVFDGKHSLIVGGYSQLPRALLKHPSPLDVRLGKTVSQVNYNIWARAQPTSKAMVECEDGEVFAADYVVSAVPLGVLKENKPCFEPPLPTWKKGAIQRIGFGLLNKVILVFEHIFWDRNVDYFGILNQGQPPNSVDQRDYTSTRGKYFFIINCAKTSGRPVLVALVAGEAAHFMEKASDQMVVDELVDRLGKIFKVDPMPRLEEVVITRWKRDRFAYGSYSYLGPEALPGDYDDMAKPVSNLFFAGEATCKNYPATVHGAYLSGLRAASEVFEAMTGPIPVSQLLQ